MVCILDKMISYFNAFDVKSLFARITHFSSMSCYAHKFSTVFVALGVGRTWLLSLSYVLLEVP